MATQTSSLPVVQGVKVSQESSVPTAQAVRVFEPENNFAGYEVMTTQHIVHIPPEPLTGEEAMYNLSSAEVTLFSYQRTVIILALIDAFFTVLNLTAFFYPHSYDFKVYWAIILGLLFAIGPIFGYFGASRLLVWPVWVYCGFVIAKTIYQVPDFYLLVHTIWHWHYHSFCSSFQVWLFFVYPYFWLLLCAAVQIWVRQFARN